MVRIIFSRSARDDLKEIYDYYKSAGETVAIKLLHKIKDRIDILMTSPLVGKVEFEIGDPAVSIRALIMGKRYKILYYEEEEYVYILAIWDCRQKPDSLFYKLNKLLK